MTATAVTRRTHGFIVRIGGCVRSDARLFARALGWRLVLPVLKHAEPAPRRGS